MEIGAPRGSHRLSALDHRKVEPGMVAGHGGGPLGPHGDREEGARRGQGVGKHGKHCFPNFAPMLPGLNSLIFNNLIQKERILAAVAALNISLT